MFRSSGLSSRSQVCRGRWARHRIIYTASGKYPGHGIFSWDEIGPLAPNGDVHGVQPVSVEMGKLDLNHANTQRGLPLQCGHQHARGLHVKHSKTPPTPFAQTKWQARREAHIGRNNLVGFAQKHDSISRRDTCRMWVQLQSCKRNFMNQCFHVCLQILGETDRPS